MRRREPAKNPRIRSKGGVKKQAGLPGRFLSPTHVGTMGANSIGGRRFVGLGRVGGRRGEFLTSSFNTPTATFGTWLAEGRKRKRPAAAADNWFPPSGRDGRTLWTGRPRPPKKNQILSCPQTAHSVPVRATLRVPNTLGGRECPVADVTACA